MTDIMVKPFREEALKAFEKIGLPAHNAEEYKFTPITRLLQKKSWRKPTSFTPAGVNEFLIPDYEAETIVMVNGKFAPELSSYSSKNIMPLADAIEENKIKNFDELLTRQDPFALLNSAKWTDGIYISVESETPILILHLSSENEVEFHTRNFIHIAEGAKGTVIEKFNYTHSVYHNAAVEIYLERKSDLEYYTLQESPECIQVNNTVILQKERSKVTTFTLTHSGELVRNNLEIKIDGEYCESHFNGLYLVNGNTIIDNHTAVDHRKPNSFSHEMYKGVISGHGKGIFNGKIFVRPDAQKTNAFQSNRNVVLSDTGAIHAKPQLEIWADDVKCSHGCTTGRLNEEALFYLRSRGLGKDKAHSLLVHAFMMEVIDCVPHGVLKKYLNKTVSERLNTRLN